MQCILTVDIDCYSDADLDIDNLRRVCGSWLTMRIRTPGILLLADLRLHLGKLQLL
jgi:hypothetical protein